MKEQAHMQTQDPDLNNFVVVLAYAERLHRNGYERTGKWDLAQVLDHLTYFMKGSLDGYTFKVPWIIKALLGKFVLRRILSQKRMKRGVFTPQKPLPVPGGDEAAALERFRETLHRTVNHQGEFQPSPFFGQLTREESLELNLIHCRHHLGYLIPKS
jgi:hypothetical protein